jgi:membrane protein
LWLQISWRVVLFGAEVSFAHQNVDTYEFEHDCLNVSHAFKRLLALRIMCEAAKHFASGQPPLTANQITDELDIPIRLVRDILYELTEVKLLAELRDASDRQSSYAPARDIHQLTVLSVLEALGKKGTDKIPVVEDKELAKISESLRTFDDLVRHSPENRLLKDI